MALKKDKEKVIDPVWGEARIREFLNLQPPQGENADFHKLLKAYQSMRVEDFQRFVEFFVEAGGNLKAANANQQTVDDIIATHRYSQPYRDALSN
jgi:hypothetical protein